MKANKFVKKFGWDAIKHEFYVYFKEENIGTIKILTHNNESIEVNGDDLKRLVESHELVEYMGGIDKAKEQAYVLTMEVDGFNPEKLEQAILDVESCQ